MKITFDTLHKKLQDIERKTNELGEVNKRFDELERLIDQDEPTLFRWMLATAGVFILAGLSAVGVYATIFALVR